MLYAVVAAIVVTLLVGSAAAMVWDPRRRDRGLNEFEGVRDIAGATDEFAQMRGNPWPRKEMI